MKKIYVVLSVLLLAACNPNAEILQQTLPGLKGQNISVAMEEIGIPDDVREVNGDEVYVWRTQETHTYIAPVTTNSYGSVNSYGHYGGYGSYGGTYGGTDYINASSTSYVPQSQNVMCEIKMLAKKKIIQQIELSGQDIACRKYAERLKHRMPASAE